MDFVVRPLRENPELAVFLTLAVGFLIGRVKIGSFSLGTVVGTLLAGVLIGQLTIKVPYPVPAGRGPQARAPSRLWSGRHPLRNASSIGHHVIGR